MLKIYYVNQFANAPDMPGGTRQYEISKELKRNGINTEIFSSDLNLASRKYTRRKITDKSVIRENINEVPFNWIYTNIYEKNDWKRVANMINFSFNLYKGLKKREKPDYIIGSSPQLFAAFAAAKAAKFHNVPFLFEVRDIWPQTLIDMTGHMGISSRIFDKIANYLYNKAQKIIVLAKGTTRYLKEYGIDENKIIYIPNGAHENPHIPISNEAKNLSRLKLGLPKQKILCVYAGAHSLANGLDNIIEAATLLRGKDNIGFVLIGDGPMKMDLVNLATEKSLKNVFFLDPIPKDEMREILPAMDIGLLVLKNAEVFKYGISPNKLFDYFANGLPVIATTPGEIGSLINDSRSGEVIEAERPEQLAKCIISWAQDPEKREEAQLAGKTLLREQFSWEKLSERFEEMLKSNEKNTSI